MFPTDPGTGKLAGPPWFLAAGGLLSPMFSPAGFTDSPLSGRALLAYLLLVSGRILEVDCCNFWAESRAEGASGWESLDSLWAGGLRGLSFFLEWVLGSLLSYLLYILGYNFAIYFCYLSYYLLRGAGVCSMSMSVFSMWRER